jgi:hypothetical protein
MKWVPSAGSAASRPPSPSGSARVCAGMIAGASGAARTVFDNGLPIGETDRVRDRDFNVSLVS